MKATELRLGNYVMNLEEEIDRITGISDPVIATEKIPGDIDVWVDPIPLTEEWFLKFGFAEDKIRSQFFKSCGEYIMKISVNVFSGTLKKESSWFVSILTGYGSQPVTLVKQYVHQIQNLYFELDKELKIK